MIDYLEGTVIFERNYCKLIFSYVCNLNYCKLFRTSQNVGGIQDVNLANSILIDKEIVDSVTIGFCIT